MEQQIRVEAKLSPHQTCGFCRDVFVDADARFDCPTCRMAFHRDCFDDELEGRCVTIGCAGYRPPLRQRISLVRARRRRRRRRRVQRGEIEAEGRRQGARTALLILAVSAPLTLGLMDVVNPLIWFTVIPSVLILVASVWNRV